jgi:hypothetical protein
MKSITEAKMKSSWSKPIWLASPDVIALALILAAQSIKVR